MKKIIIRILIIILIIEVLFQMFKWTGVLKSYTISTGSSEPNLQLGDHIITTNLIEPKKLDFISFKHHFENEYMNGDYELVFRLCATERDTINIKDGILFINGINIDKNLILKHLYKFHSNELENILGKVEINDYNYNSNLKDSVSIQLTNKQAVKLGKSLSERIIENKINPEIQNEYNESWNSDNFGPLIVPKGKMFVIGDNRKGSLDSRYIGLIDSNKLVGTVIYIIN